MTTDTQTVATATVGEFGTYSIGSDRYPVEIIAVSPRKITTRGAEVIASGALPGDAEYANVPRGTYTVHPNANGTERVFTLRGDGAWRMRGGDYGRLTLGSADFYRDPSF